MIRSHRRLPKQEQRSETVTVTLGVFHDTTVTLTYSIDATLCTGATGGAGFISARPTQVRLSDQKGERIEQLYAPAAKPRPARKD